MTAIHYLNKRKYSLSAISLFQFLTLLSLLSLCLAEEDVSQGQLLINKYLECNDAGQRENILKSLDDLHISLDKAKSWIRESKRYNATKPGIYRKLAPVGERKGEYFLYVPAFYTPNKLWPAIIALHGVGESGYSQIRSWLSASNHNDEYIIVAPTYGPGLWWKEEAEQLVTSIINDVLRNFPIDTNRMYLTGFSSGGHAAWYFAIRYPWLFAAINPIAGECPFPSLLSNLMHVSV